ncbi:MAG: TonB-dependent receptor [Rhodospirillaceae bacterium]|jgi:outer membrane receptor protein involved in Fe transport|nr:TonB-dependent receptor [Rhodospirillaceae bacterium]MBT6088846.1 TonB-dependent receptor [Rhodospirillaceae bacterium]MBT6961194.1 TonB-dependent receptor [Rhodospirillaceae bacterium]
MTRNFSILAVICLSLVAAETRSQSVDEILVTSKRLPDSLSSGVYSAQELTGTVLDGPSFGLDAALRRVPGFGLFRRQASRAAHPTTQGVSLRGLGPNGAGRTLVLLDGVPLNDPFGGWVEWVHLPPSTIQRATIVRGGGSGTWGNAALAGVVRLDSRSLSDENLRAEIRYGSKDSIAGSALFNADAAGGSLSGAVHFSDSGGFFLVGSDQRGAADLPAARHNEGLRLNWRTETESGTVWSLSADAASDTFVNGSSEAGAQTDTYGLSLSAVNPGSSSGPAWQTHVYARQKDFQSVFAAFDGTRSSVRPVLDQFDVPVLGLGANFLLRWSDVNDWTIESGADIRFSDGETNEAFRNFGAGFTRQRTAGGEQLVAGSFVEGHRQLSTRTLITFGVRADYWSQSKGIRRETDLTNDSILVDRSFAGRDGVSVNGRAGFRTQISETLDVRSTVYSGFRVPTLNELYRPFRVGNDITEANEALVNERMVGAEAAVIWSRGNASAQATVFRNDLFDPVLNTTITNTPGFNSEFGVFIPGGGSLRQRRNVDRVETWGVEFDASLQISERVQARAGYLFTDPKIANSRVAPALEGNRLAQVAKHQATFGLMFTPTDRLRLTADLLLSSDQFEDDLNSRVLKGAATVDVYAGYDLTDSIEVYVAAENLFDERVEAGRTAAGLVTLGPPVFLWTGLRLKY